MTLQDYYAICKQLRPNDEFKITQNGVVFLGASRFESVSDFEKWLIQTAYGQKLQLTLLCEDVLTVASSGMTAAITHKIVAACKVLAGPWEKLNATVKPASPVVAESAAHEKLMTAPVETRRVKFEFPTGATVRISKRAFEQLPVEQLRGMTPSRAGCLILMARTGAVCLVASRNTAAGYTAVTLLDDNKVADTAVTFAVPTNLLEATQAEGN